MPLIQSPSKAALGQNISELSSSGKRPHAQVVAIALSAARKNGAKIPGPKSRPYRDNAKIGA